MEKTIELYGQNIEAKSLLAASYIQIQEFEKANQIIDELMLVNPDDKATQLLKMKLNNISNGGQSERLEYINKVIASDTTYFMNYYYKGQELIKLERYKEAIEAFTKALELEPNHRYSFTVSHDLRVPI